ncbi:hypothetical protein [uncultured Rikenella sp.]|uniref:hypothetical protein n=1 Tax=uncultured Rikenella sp. TaxID=368003 RepID=UPI002617E50D|nr:hypothetical protein [uncultured Rikenella sp.]
MGNYGIYLSGTSCENGDHYRGTTLNAYTQYLNCSFADSRASGFQLRCLPE